MSKRRVKTYAKTVLLIGTALVVTALMDTAWSYTSDNANAQAASTQVRIR